MRQTRIFLLTSLILPCLILMWIFPAHSASTREKIVQDVFVFAPDELDPGSDASFRVVVHRVEGILNSVPVEDAKVSIFIEQKKSSGWSFARHSSRLINSRTDASGTVSDNLKVPDLPAEGEYELRIKVSSPLGEVEKKHAVKITPRYKLLLTTDKPLYQPGQLIHIRAVGLKLSNLKPVADAEITLEVEDPQGNKVFKKSGKSDPYGVFSGDFQLADEIRHGDYIIRALCGEKSSEKTVAVKKYVLPKFKVSLETREDYYKPAQTVHGSVKAEYFFGKLVEGGEVMITAQTFDVGFHTIGEIKGKTDNQGNFEFELQLPEHFVGQPLEKGAAFVKLEAKVRDQAEHTETASIQRKVVQADLQLDVVPEAGRLIPGVENRLYLLVATPDNKPVEGNVTLLFKGKEYLGKSDKSGIAEILFTPRPEDFVSAPPEPGKVKPRYTLSLKARAQDLQGRKATITREFSAEHLRDSVLLRTNRAIYSAGDALELQVLATQSVGSVYVDLIRNTQTMLTQALELQDGRAAKRITLSPEWFGTLEVHAYVILPTGEVTRDTRIIYVEQAHDLKISVSLDKDIYRPAERAKLVFKVSDTNGAAEQAVLGISIVDESVFAIQDMIPGLLKVYFTLEAELAKPRYEVHFAPHGQTVEALVQEKQELGLMRDKVMKVLTAGVEKPSKPGWEENPAKARFEQEKSRISPYAHAFLQYALKNDFLSKHRYTGWKFKENITDILIAQKTLQETQAKDSFGSPYQARTLSSFAPEFALRKFSESITAHRMKMLLADIHKQALKEQTSSLRKLFVKTSSLDIPEDILSRVVSPYTKDVWGKEFRLSRLSSPREVPVSGYQGEILSQYDLRSAGPDAKFDTSDDISQPWKYTLPYSVFEPQIFKNRDFGRLVRREGRAMGFPVPAGANALLENESMVFNTDTAASVKGSSGGSKPPRVREFFPETLFWEPALITDSSGRAELPLSLADSITSWRLTALGHSASGLLGSTTKGIKVFQDFFVDIDFPVQLTQGDEVEIPVAIYNYLPGEQKISLEIREHEGFKLLSKGVQELSLSSGEVDVRYFRMKAEKAGRQILTVYALGEKMSDAVKRTVEVIPDGKRVEVVKNGRLSGDLKEEITIPPEAIADASRVMLKIYPGVFAQILEGLDGIFRMPHGCFEQTTSTTYPNIMTLAYMKQTDTVSPEIQMKAEGFINLGYQRLLSFEVPGGGFEWFGKAPAHKVLTAYGLMEFYDMSKVYPIDEAVIQRTQQWLSGQQEKDGSWKPAQHWMETLSGDAFSKSVELNTAYIAWALAESEYKGKSLQKAITYLKSEREGITDAYTLALAVNAMVAADPKDRQAREILKELDQLKIEDKLTKAIHWEPAGKTAVHGAGKAAMIETTSLILYAMTKAGLSSTTVSKGLSWLSQQKDAFGTFQSTQATILALRALIAAEQSKTADISGSIKVSMGQRSEVLEITPDNSDVLRLVDFKNQTIPGKQEVKITAPSELPLMYQLAAVYYLPWEKTDSMPSKPLLKLDVEYDRKSLQTDDLLTAKVSAEYLGKNAADMIILDLGIPPGFNLKRDALNKLKADEIIEKYSVTGRQITIYIRRMETGSPLRFSYKLRAKFPIKAQTPKSTAYEYYNPDNKVSVKPVLLEVAKKG